MIFGNGRRDVRGRNVPYLGDELDAKLRTLRSSLPPESYAQRHIDFFPKTDIRIVIPAIGAALVMLLFPIDHFRTKNHDGGFYNDDANPRIANAISESVNEFNDQIDGGSDTVSTLYKDLLSQEAIDAFAYVCWRTEAKAGEGTVEANKILNRAGAITAIIRNYTDEKGNAIELSEDAHRNFIAARDELYSNGWLNQSLSNSNYAQFRKQLEPTIKQLEIFETEPKEVEIQASPQILNEHDEVITPEPCKGQDLSDTSESKGSAIGLEALSIK